MDPDTTVYVSKSALEDPRTNGPVFHVREDCNQVQAMDVVVEMTLTEAKEKCTRQAWCCSLIPTLEDHN